MKLLIETEVQGHFLDVFAGFNVQLFKTLTPPLTTIHVWRFDGCTLGDEVHLEVKLLGLIKQQWINKITSTHQSTNEVSFTDEGVEMPAPLSKWRHVHTIKKLTDTSSVIVDDIDYSSGSRVIDSLLYPILYAMFSARRPIYRKEFS